MGEFLAGVGACLALLAFLGMAKLMWDSYSTEILSFSEKLRILMHLPGTQAYRMSQFIYEKLAKACALPTKRVEVPPSASRPNGEVYSQCLCDSCTHHICEFIDITLNIPVRDKPPCDWRTHTLYMCVEHLDSTATLLDDTFFDRGDASNNNFSALIQKMMNAHKVFAYHRQAENLRTQLEEVESSANLDGKNIEDLISRVMVESAVGGYD